MSTEAKDSAMPGGERRPGHQANASVALDIGIGRGALVIYPGERYRGSEIEISRTEEIEHRVHTGVHDRHTASGPVLTAIFGSLPVGEYVVWVDDETAGPTISIPDGSVAELRLS
jgi:hypothetical protein